MLMSCITWLLVATTLASTVAADDQLKLTSCSQSSTSHNGVCERAIDGITNQDYNDGSCSHTDDPEANWWQASTGRRAFIREVRIYNRLDCCSDRLNDIVVTVDGRVCASYTSANYFKVWRFNCNRAGQVLKIKHRQQKVPLSFCEVEVFGEDQLKLTSCSQSSTSHNGVCERAIDGITNQDYNDGSCTHTDYQKFNSWWQASTERKAFIREVRIYNRLDCCSDRLNDIVVTVDGRVCASYKSDNHFTVGIFACNREGQVVRILSQQASPLSLCEVTVIGRLTG